MAFYFSTGLRNALLGEQDSITGTDLKITAGTTVTSTAGALLTAGYRPGDVIVLSGWPTAGNNTGIYTLGTVTAGSMTVSGTALNVEDGDADSKILVVSRGAFKQIFANNIIRVYSGAAPANADAVETGVLLLKLTKSSGAVVPGVITNGNNFDVITTGVLAKDANVWSGVGLADGTAGYWRLYDNGEITGASTTSKRCQGTCGTSGTDFVMSSSTIVTGATVTLDSFNITQPAS